MAGGGTEYAKKPSSSLLLDLEAVLGRDVRAPAAAEVRGAEPAQGCAEGGSAR